MSQPQQKVLLGTILQQAGLVTTKQVEQASKQQKRNHDRKIGQILADRGHINSQTADFFAERWFKLLQEKPQQPIGQYLKQAGLLNESQIQTILKQQRQTKQKFGEMAIAKGWIERKTINFFLRYLRPKAAKQKVFGDRLKTASRIDATNFSYSNIDDSIEASSPASAELSEYGRKVHEGFLNIKRKLLNIDNLENYSEETLKRVLLWTGGQSFLTRKLFQILADNERDLSPEQEIAQIDNLVQTKLLDDWQNNQLSSHLKSIEYRLLNNQHCHSVGLLRLYQRVLTKTVFLDHSEAQQELLNMGLAVKQGDTLVVANRIYQSVFDLDWVNGVLSQLHSVKLPNKSFEKKSDATHSLRSKQARPAHAEPSSASYMRTSPLFAQSPARQDDGTDSAVRRKARLEKVTHRACPRVERNPHRDLGTARQSVAEVSSVEERSQDSRNGVHKGRRKRSGHPTMFPAVARQPRPTTPDKFGVSSRQDRTFPQGNAHQDSDRFAKFKNIALILISLGLLSIIINSVARQRAVKVAFQKGNQLLQQKSFSEAIARYDRLLEIDSNYFQAWTNRGYALAGLKQYEAMHESCAAATIIEPTAVYAWNCQGEALHNLQRSSEAIIAFDRAIALDRTNSIFLINKSESLKDLGRYEESLEVIETAVGILEQIEAISGTENVSGEFAVALAFLGNAYRREERYQDALNAYNRSLNYSDNYFPAQIGKGITLSRAELYREARAEFESILDNESLSEAQQAQTWFYLGKTFCKSRQNALGIAAFERSLELQPSYIIAEEAMKQCS